MDQFSELNPPQNNNVRTLKEQTAEGRYAEEYDAVISGRLTRKDYVKRRIAEDRQHADKLNQVTSLVERDTKLTSLLNHRTFLGRFENKISENARRVQEGKAVSISGGILFLDIDDFKEINTNYGYTTADHILKQIADVLQDIRPGDAAGRYGGDEFEVYLDGNNLDSCVIAAQRIRTEIATRVFNLLGITIGISIGVQAVPDYIKPEDVAKDDRRIELAAALVEDASDALKRRAKQSGKNNTAVIMPDESIKIATTKPDPNDPSKTIVVYSDSPNE